MIDRINSNPSELFTILRGLFFRIFEKIIDKLNYSTLSYDYKKSEFHPSQLDVLLYNYQSILQHNKIKKPFLLMIELLLKKLKPKDITNSALNILKEINNRSINNIINAKFKQ